MQNIPNLRTVCADPFEPEELIGLSKINGELEKLLESPAGVWEGYTIEQHTLMVFKMFEKYWSRFFGEKEKEFWRLFLLFHDIGKPISVEKYGDKKQQHETTWPILEAGMKASDCSELEILRAKLLLEQDILGSYFKDKVGLEKAVKQILHIHRGSEWTIEETLFRVKVYFCSDAAAYTTFAGGKYSLDYLFAVDEEKQTINFSDEHNDKPEYQEFTTLGKFEVLEAAASTASMAGKLP